MYGSDNSKIGLLVGAVLLGSGLLSRLLHRFSVGRLLGGGTKHEANSADDAAILAFYGAGHTFTNAGEGTVLGMRYITYAMVATDPNTSFVNASAVVNVLDLPFNTTTHLIGLSKQHKADRLEFKNFVRANGMEKVELEGDFSDYFDLYAATGQQVTVREVLAPDAMAFVVDYCRSHFWEINNAELYIVASDDDKTGGNIMEEGVKFVNQIRPALLPGEPGAPVVHHEVSYGEYDGPPLNCPLCSTPMELHDNTWFSCNAGHGVLMTGRELAALNRHEIQVAADVAKAAQHGPLTCPNCEYAMEQVQYEEANLQIDSCTNCTYRWVDANEVVELNNRKD